MRPLSALVWAGLATALSPGLRVMLRRRAARGREILQRLPERYGRESAARPQGRLIWIHAASVGEMVSALPLLPGLVADERVLFTTGTVTSAALLGTRVAAMGLAAKVVHRFVPLDVPRWVGRFLDHWRPDLACFMESELWPNMLAGCARRGIPMALINGRMSARAARGWGRVPGLARHMLGGFALVAAQSGADAARLRDLGAAQVEMLGNLKFAAPPLPADAAALAGLVAAVAGRPRWLAASIHPADDAVVAAVHAQVSARIAGVVTALVPRHPERGADLAARFGAGRRSLGAGPPPEGGVWVADTLGELGVMYRCFPVVFMGKSFAGGGGQNPWEPAQLGCAVAAGPDMANFTEAVGVLRAAGGLRVVADVDSLADWVVEMLSAPEACAAMGARARAATQQADGVVAALVARLLALVA